MLKRTALPSGLEVVTEAMPEARSAAVGVWVGTGSRDEAEHEAGASHFLEHLLFKGSKSRSAQEIAVAVDAVGGDMNAFTTKEYTAFHMRLLGEDLDMGLEILCDILTDPAIEESEVEAERQVILEEIAMRDDDPADVAHELATEALFPGHPLGRDPLGTEEVVSAMGAAEVADFFARHYRPANMVLAVAGEVDHDAVVEMADVAFRRPGGSRPVRSACTEPAEREVSEIRPGEQAHLVVAMSALDRFDERRWTLDVVDHVLGGGLSSRLFQEVRERRGLAYSVYSDRVFYCDAGTFLVYAGTTASHLEELHQVVGDELARMATLGISEAELKVAKGHFRASLLLGLEDPGSRMSRIGRSVLLHGKVLKVEEILAEVAAVTAEDVGELAAQIIGGARTTVTVGPVSLAASASKGV